MARNRDASEPEKQSMQAWMSPEVRMTILRTQPQLECLKTLVGNVIQEPVTFGREGGVAAKSRQEFSLTGRQTS